MNDDIIKMAREAGFTNPEQFNTSDDTLRGILEDFWENLEHFAALVAAAEREACAQVCEEMGRGHRFAFAEFDCAQAIRARGNE